jgi:D-aspartate ligase
VVVIVHGSVPAVVVGGDLSGLGIARSLWLDRVPVFVVTTKHRPAMWSRSCRSVVVDRLYGEPLVAGLLDLQRRIGERPILFLTDEMSVYTVSECRSELEDAYRFHLPTEEMVFSLSDKAAFQKLAEDNGFPVPRSVVLETARHVGRLGELKFPVIMKPTDKHFFHSGQTDRIHKVGTLDEAVTLCSRILPKAKKVIVQEWIPGPDGDIYFCLFYCGRDAKIRSIFTGRKIRSEPAELGSTVICRAAPDARHLLEPLTANFVDCVGFVGIGSLEFKRDTTSDRFVIIEPTVGRADWQEEIATLCGVNIPLAAYNHEFGLPPLSIERLRDDVAWRASFLKAWPPHESRAGLNVYDGFWRFNDPMPAIFHYMIDTVFRHAIDPLLRRRTVRRSDTIKPASVD